MPIAITFILKSKHVPTKNAYSQVVAVPAIPATAGLYVIRNKDHASQVYAGTSGDVKDRFNNRLQVYRESGFDDTVLARLRFYLVKIKVDDVSKSVGDNGQINTQNGIIDVENLFVRSIVARANCNVLNVGKWQSFTNPFGAKLDVEFEGFPATANYYFVPANFSIASHATI